MWRDDIDSIAVDQENRSATSLIALAARKTTTIWSALGEWKVSLPAPPTPTGTKESKTRAKVRLFSYRSLPPVEAT